MSDANYVIYVKNAIFGAFAIGHMSYTYMAIWVSKDALGPQEFRPRPLMSFVNGFTSLEFQNTHF